MRKNTKSRSWRVLMKFLMGLFMGIAIPAACLGLDYSSDEALKSLFTVFLIIVAGILYLANEQEEGRRSYSGGLFLGVVFALIWATRDLPYRPLEGTGLPPREMQE